MVDIFLSYSMLSNYFTFSPWDISQLHVRKNPVHGIPSVHLPLCSTAWELGDGNKLVFSIALVLPSILWKGLELRVDSSVALLFWGTNFSNYLVLYLTVSLREHFVHCSVCNWLEFSKVSSLEPWVRSLGRALSHHHCSWGQKIFRTWRPAFPMWRAQETWWESYQNAILLLGN